jgi:hypothetical protein
MNFNWEEYLFGLGVGSCIVGLGILMREFGQCKKGEEGTTREGREQMR